jgi:hypothetical protein
MQTRVVVSKDLQRCSVCVPAKIFLISKFSYLLFSNPTHETKTLNANRWETANSNPPGPIQVFSNQQKVVGFCYAFSHLHKLCKQCWAKTILLSQTGMLSYFSSNVNLQGHILSIALCICGCDEYVTLKEYFSHPSFRYLLFSNPTYEMEIEAINRWESTNRNPPR